MEKDDNEDVAIEHVVDRLTEQFPAVPAEVVHDTVTDIHGSFDQAAVRDFVPVIVEHDAKEKLRAEYAPGAAPDDSAAEPPPA